MKIDTLIELLKIHKKAERAHPLNVQEVGHFNSKIEKTPHFLFALTPLSGFHSINLIFFNINARPHDVKKSLKKFL